MEVSIYRNSTDIIGATGELKSFLITDKWKHLSEQVRAESDKEWRSKLKRELLPCCTPSGVFRERKKEGLIKHTGLICIDVDGAENPSINDWEGMVSEFGHLKETMFAGLSVSGKGAFIIIKIADPKKHEDHFRAIEQDFEEMGIIIDHACKDVTRMRYYSYNPDLFINEDSLPYKSIYRPQTVKVRSFYKNGDDVTKLVEKAVSMGIDIVPDYLTWFEVGAALSNVPNGRELFHALSSINGEKYDTKQCDKQFKACKEGKGISVSTLFYHAKNKGVTLL